MEAKNAMKANDGRSRRRGDVDMCTTPQFIQNFK